VIEFDSALNIWFDSVPTHREYSLLRHSRLTRCPRFWTVRWDPACKDDIFFDVSGIHDRRGERQLTAAAAVSGFALQLSICSYSDPPSVHPRCPALQDPHGELSRPFNSLFQMRELLTAQAFPSLAICNSAARACSHVAEIHLRRRPKNPLIFGQVSIHTVSPCFPLPHCI
jgi:hypothetical protein